MHSETTAQARATVLDVVLRYLTAERVTHVFGVAGGLLHAFFERSAL